MLKILSRQQSALKCENEEKSLLELLHLIEYQMAESKDIFNFSDDDDLIAIMQLRDRYLIKYREYILAQIVNLKQSAQTIES